MKIKPTIETTKTSVLGWSTLSMLLVNLHELRVGKVHRSFISLLPFYPVKFHADVFVLLFVLCMIRTQVFDVQPSHCGKLELRTWNFLSLEMFPFVSTCFRQSNKNNSTPILWMMLLWKDNDRIFCYSHDLLFWAFNHLPLICFICPTT